MRSERTQVAIVGAGPAGLLLSHLLAARGIDSIVIDKRSRDEIESTIRAGILEHSTATLLADHVPGSRVYDVGSRHDGVELRFAGEGHRIDFADLTGRSVWLYPQHEVLKDLIAARTRQGQDLRFSTAALRVEDPDGARPIVVCDGPDGPLAIQADAVVGADGSRSVVREAVAGAASDGYFREYPFAWYGVLCEAPPSADELIYSNSDHGFALISQRSPTVQRMYFQCDPEAHPDDWTDEQIWETLQKRVEGTALHSGPIFQRDVLRFRSFVASRLSRGRVALAGDAAHTVPPTGAKGMNLAIADVVVLVSVLDDLLHGDDGALSRYESTVTPRIWKAQHFSWWMTQMLHAAPDATPFDRRRQEGELRSVVDSESGRRFLAEGYTGWPFTVS